MRERLADLASRGFTNKQICDATGAHQSSVSRWAKRMGITLASGPTTSQVRSVERHAEFARLAAEGLSAPEIAARCDVSLQPVWKWMRKTGSSVATLSGRPSTARPATAERFAEYARLAADGGTADSIAAACGVGRAAISRWAKANDVVLASPLGGAPRSGRAKLRREVEYERLAEQGMSVNEIAAALGVSISPIQTWLRKRNQDQGWLTPSSCTITDGRVFRGFLPGGAYKAEPEARLRDDLAVQVAGVIEARLPFGRPDILSADRVYEVEPAHTWRAGVMQVLAYAAQTGTQGVLAVCLGVTPELLSDIRAALAEGAPNIELMWHDGEVWH